MIDPKMFDDFRRDTEAALAEVAKKYNVDIKAGHISYGNINFKMTLEVTEKVNGTTDAGEAMWSYYCKSYGFERDDFGKIITLKGKKYQISGIDNRSKFSIITKCLKDDKEYQWLPDIVKTALEEAKRGE